MEFLGADHLSQRRLVGLGEQLIADAVGRWAREEEPRKDETAEQDEDQQEPDARRASNPGATDRGRGTIVGFLLLLLAQEVVRVLDAGDGQTGIALVGVREKRVGDPDLGRAGARLEVEWLPTAPVLRPALASR